MTDKDNLAFIQDVYSKFGRGDVPGILDALSDDVDWHLLGPDELSLGRARKGKDEVLEFFVTIGEELDVEAFEPREFIAQGDKVVVVGRETMRVRSTGRAFDVEWVHIFALRDGKIARFREYTDTAAVLAAYR